MRTRAISFFILLLSPFVIRGQADSLQLGITKKCDTLTMNNFNKKIKYYYKNMKEGKEFPEPEYVIVVKLYLTIPEKLTGTKKEKLYRNFVKYYRLNYMGRYCDIMECVFLKGLVVYSNKYKIYLSATKEKLPCNNYFFIK